MLTQRKKFDKKIYDENDNAKNLVIEWLDTYNYDAWVNPDTYGIDILSTNRKNGKTRSFEVEVKHNWSGPTFPFPTVHIPERKRKYCNSTSLFVMFNHERTHFILVRGSVVGSSPVVTKTTKYTPCEQFFEIPISLCIVGPLKELDNG